MKLTRSSGNVFGDLGFAGDEAEYRKVGAALMVTLQTPAGARSSTTARVPSFEQAAEHIPARH